MARSVVRRVTGGQGFEPRFSGPKPDVLPLDDPPRGRATLPAMAETGRSRPPLGAPRHAPRAGAVLGGGAAGGGDAKHAHRLQAETELLAAVARAHVEPGELAHALKPVVDG